jgi:hypothetical protein
VIPYGNILPDRSLQNKNILIAQQLVSVAKQSENHGFRMFLSPPSLLRKQGRVRRRGSLCQ